MNKHKSAARAVSALLLIFMLVTSAFTQGNAAKSNSTPQISMSKPSGTMPRDERLWQRALKLHRSAIIVDGHNDIPTIMVDDDYDIATPSAGKYHTDLARMKQGGMTGEFFLFTLTASMPRKRHGARWT
jgi:hypothetical protein